MKVSEKRSTLTSRQSEIYEFLKGRILNRGYGPTVREIGDHFNIKSPNGVMCHLKALEKKGLISRESNMSRAIGLVNNSGSGLSLPFIGTAVSGSPIQSAVSSDERVDFDTLFSGDDNACIRVKGIAFLSLGIADGDYIVVSRGARGEEGCLLAALDDRHSVTLYRDQGNGKQPVPAVPGAYPAPTRQILGSVVGVVRTLIAPAGSATVNSSVNGAKLV